MNRCKDRLYVGVLWSLIALLGCGGGGGSSTAPDDKVEQAIPPEAVAVTNVLVQSFQSAFFASLTADTTAVAGFNGKGLVQIEGKKRNNLSRRCLASQRCGCGCSPLR